jgi:hypothetical protein
MLYPETEKLCPIAYHWIVSSVLIKEIWGDGKCVTILENNLQIPYNMTALLHIFMTSKSCLSRLAIVLNLQKHSQS